MMAPQKKKSLPGQHHKMGVRDSAAEAVEIAKHAKAAETTGTAKTAEAGKALPPDQPPDDNAPVTRGEFREEVNRLDKKMEVGFAELDKKMEVGFAELDKKMEVGFAETKAELKGDISDTKAELKGDISNLRNDFHESEKKMLRMMVSTIVSMTLAALAAMSGMMYYALNMMRQMM